MVKNTSSVNLSVSSKILAEASAFADHSAKDFLLTGKEKSALSLTIEELISNCTQHGGMDRGNKIQLNLTVTTDELLLEMTDCGKSFNPLLDLENGKQNYQTLKNCYMGGSVDEREPGGLGWPIINHFFEIIDYSRHDQQNNLLLRYTRTQ